jgi:hypothetical protein
MNFLRLVKQEEHPLEKFIRNTSTIPWSPADYVPFCLRIQTFSINEM